MNLLKFAYHNCTGKIIHIDKASNGLNCDCKCDSCGEKLEAIQGLKNEWHFRHSRNSNCTGGQETALHKLGKQIILDNSEIAIPNHGIITYSAPIAEKPFKNIQPDVTASYNGETIFFEIRVLHSIDSNKEKIISDNQQKCVEIDLSGELNSSFEEIENIILRRIDKKKILFWTTNEVQNDSILGKILLLFFGLFFLRWLIQQFNKRISWYFIPLILCVLIFSRGFNNFEKPETL